MIEKIETFLGQVFIFIGYLCMIPLTILISYLAYKLGYWNGREDEQEKEQERENDWAEGVEG